MSGICALLPFTAWLARGYNPERHFALGPAAARRAHPGGAALGVVSASSRHHALAGHASLEKRQDAQAPGALNAAARAGDLAGGTSGRKGLDRTLRTLSGRQRIRR